MTKKGLRDFDARAAVLRLAETGAVDEKGEQAELEVWLRHQEPAVRPDDVLSGLRAVGDLPDDPAPRVTRLAQGPWDEAEQAIGDPLA